MQGFGAARIWFLWMLLLTCCVMGLGGQSVGINDSAFPLTPGTHWIYQGILRWTHEDSSKVSQKKLTWNMELVRVIHREGLVAAVIQGHPSDLAWSTGHPQREYSLLIRARDDKFYFIGHEGSFASLQRLENSHDSLESLLGDEDLLFQMPLAQGSKFCGPDGKARDDAHYCWVVESAKPASLEGVKGVPPGQKTAYLLRWRSNPDDSEIEFVPGIGITAYSYHHHGTVADAELKLVEYQPASAN